MNVLVTGARGWVGSHIVRALLPRGHNVYAVIRNGVSPRLAEPKEGSGRLFTITSEFDVAMRASVRFDLVIHSAWYVNPKDYLFSDENKVCLEKSLALLDQVGGIRSVFLGTCFEYDLELGFLSEDSPTKPQSLYAACKDILRTKVEKCKTAAWARLFYQFGPWEKPERLVPLIIKSLTNVESLLLPAGVRSRDYLHIEDVASAVCSVAESDVTGCVNIGSGGGAPLLGDGGIVNELELISGVRGVVGVDHAPRKKEPPCIVANNLLLRSTGWAPKYTLKSGLRHTFEWWKSHGV